MRKGFVFIILILFNLLLMYGINRANVLMFNNNFMIYLNKKDEPIKPKEEEQEQEKEEYYLNSLNLGNEYQYLKEIEHNFYTKKRKEEIIKKFEERAKNNGK